MAWYSHPIDFSLNSNSPRLRPCQRSLKSPWLAQGAELCLRTYVLQFTDYGTQKILTDLFFLSLFRSIVTTPTELIKIRQQSMLTPTKARQVALKIFRENGIRGLYRGMPVTALRDCGYGAYFAAVCNLYYL